MSKNKNKHRNQPTFNVAPSEEKPKINPDFEAAIPERIDAQPFRWCFLDDEMRWNNNFCFKDYKKDLRKFLQEIEQPLFNLYRNLTWYEVNTKENCGKYKEGLTNGQKAIASFPHKPDGEQLYHIKISQKHRLFGYRSDDNIFHITINDPDHEFNKL